MITQTIFWGCSVLTKGKQNDIAHLSGDVAIDQFLQFYLIITNKDSLIG